ncbi:Cleavage polyadenylation factor subunit clp1 [Termitomyces sp. T159_Od127]|nr:Cleavage polyadenylation factor subunit clp1 [Termitomyces sp. T159_Od127]
MTTEAKPAAPKKEWDLEPESEYRFELDPGTTLAIKPSTEYVSDETPMAAYANLHIAFEQMRVRALRVVHGSPSRGDDPLAITDPPRVLVLGPENSGKTTVCKILVNYAVRAGQGWSPLLVNVDPSEGGWAAPGAISAASVYSPIPTCSPANPLGSAATSAPTALPANALLPLVYWYGHAETRRNPLLMDRIIRNLGENIKEKYDYDAEGYQVLSWTLPRHSVLVQELATTGID